MLGQPSVVTFHHDLGTLWESLQAGIEELFSFEKFGAYENKQLGNPPQWLQTFLVIYRGSHSGGMKEQCLGYNRYGKRKIPP